MKKEISAEEKAKKSLDKWGQLSSSDAGSLAGADKSEKINQDGVEKPENDQPPNGNGDQIKGPPVKKI